MTTPNATLIVRPTPLFALFAPIKYLVIGILFLIAAIFAKPYVPMEHLRYLILAILGFTLLAYGFNYLFIRSIKYTITQEQIIFTRGVFTIKTDYIELYRIVDSMVIRSFLLRLIDAMSFHLDTLDKSHPIFVLKGIPKSNLQDYVRSLVEKARLNNRVFITE